MPADSRVYRGCFKNAVIAGRPFNAIVWQVYRYPRDGMVWCGMVWDGTHGGWCGVVWDGMGWYPWGMVPTGDGVGPCALDGHFMLALNAL